MEKVEDIYKPKLKLFGERAERIKKEDYNNVVEMLLRDLGGGFHEIKPVEQLEDKESFGDIDIVCRPQRTIDESYFKKILGGRLLEYRRNASTHSLLVSLGEHKGVQVDFVQSGDKEDFERKLMYYSKGHFSSLVGMLARKLNFKYGTEGFFKRYKDKKGNWHDILVSGSLGDGLKILGFDVDKYESVRRTEDIVDFIAGSPFFDSRYFQFENLLSRDREQVKRSSSQDWIASKLAFQNKKRSIEDENEIFRTSYPREFKQFLEEAEKIEKETYKRGQINGGTVMDVFGLKPGRVVGKILKFISDSYPDADELSGEMIEKIKKEIILKSPPE